MTLPTASLLALIESHPEGITSQDIAKETGALLQTVSSKCSKLSMYGKIRRERYPTQVSLWLPKAKT